MEDLESALENAYEVSERIAAAYAQAELNFTQPDGLFGARVEQSSAEGFHQTAGSADSYTNILPSAHPLLPLQPENAAAPRADMMRIAGKVGRIGMLAGATFVLLECSSEQPGHADSGRASPDDGAPQPVEPAGGVGRIALSADGNQHDQDDWASSAMSLAILAQRGLQSNVVHYDYNNHIWDSDPEYRRNMTESVMGAGERFGFNTSLFYDAADPTELAAGTENLTAEINASSPDEELWVVLAGPMETAWMALDAADPQARRSVKCVSHGEWNETHGATDHGGHSYDDLIDLGCQRVQIPDQNSNLGETSMSDWDYLRDGDPAMDWLYTRIGLHGDGDVSDAGMPYYVITGEENATRFELEQYLTAPRTADPEGLAPIEISENGRVFVTTGDLISELGVTVAAGEREAGIGGSSMWSQGKMWSSPSGSAIRSRRTTAARRPLSAGWTSSSARSPASPTTRPPT